MFVRLGLVKPGLLRWLQYEIQRDFRRSGKERTIKVRPHRAHLPTDTSRAASAAFFFAAWRARQGSNLQALSFEG